MYIDVMVMIGDSTVRGGDGSGDVGNSMVIVVLAVTVCWCFPQW